MKIWDRVYKRKRLSLRYIKKNQSVKYNLTHMVTNLFIETMKKNKYVNPKSGLYIDKEKK